jgi:hypothetical protein
VKTDSNKNGGRTDAALIKESEENMDQDSFGQLEDKYSESHKSNNEL